ncbi:YitT family protein [Hazenella sp. IB182357]|uniref:YitT family protein n=1 Tax=Polycladospora coralii TaxID=2771432 RepID=A0A926NDS5_9BACL|nr:YitT family protein [Polycladospora coralii]MBD1371598.1 YitT family protein [Polycladospora coralii]MBS7529065.1 YitT family protein [Polycladospora coralii]
MKNNKLLFHARNILLIFIGTLLFSFGINYFAIPNELAEGGFTGIAILLYYMFDWTPAYIIFILNIPLIFIGLKVFGKQTFVYTIVGILFSTISLKLTEDVSSRIGTTITDPLLAALYTGVFVGAGLGLIFRTGGTTGGVDIIARLANKYFALSIGRTIFILDFAIILSSVPVIGLNKMMYTLVAIFVGARVIDFVIEGANASKAATIISNVPQKLAKTITKKMDRGVTLLKGQGGYTGKEKEVLYVVVAPNELPKLKAIVNELDSNAFVVVHDARDVLGEGFTFDKINGNGTTPS